MQGSDVALKSWVVANVAGMAFFLWWASACCWIEPELRYEPSAGAGEIILWALVPLPLFLTFSLANLAWAPVAAVRAKGGGRWTHPAIALALLAAWCAAFLIDYNHHSP